MAKNKGPTAELDPRALILEAYRIEGITGADCRTIYRDWALGVDPSRDMVRDTSYLLAHYEHDAPMHTMTDVLREDVRREETPTQRRGGPLPRRR